MRRGGMHKAASGSVALLLAGAIGCGGKGGGGDDPVVPPPPGADPIYRCADSPVAVDHVALTCNAAVNSSTWTINAVVGAPTTSTDIAGFAFDMVFDPALLTYAQGSAVAGALLFQTGAGVLLTAQTAPGDPGRLVVGIHRTGTTEGVGAKVGFDLVLRFSMKVVPGAIFDPHMVRIENFEALDPDDRVIPSITSRDQLLLSNQ